jgi:ubiquinone biosynthesis protein
MVTRFRRYGQIADVLVKYGFGVLLSDILPGVRSLRFRQTSPEAGRSVYERIRMAIEDLGPTFVKFGQIMSTREELLPPPLIEELRKLQDQVSPIPYEQVLSSDRSASLPPPEAFSGIDQVPVASASLAQVHRAVLLDGRVVALKIKRPGVDELVETDIAILQSLASRLESVFPESRIYNPKGIVHDFASQIRHELDFIHDGKNADRLRAIFSEIPGIRVPKIFWEYSSSDILVMEYAQGVRIDRTEEIIAMGINPKDLARRGFEAYMKMIFEDGFFHGDPHPGNLLVSGTGDIIFLDFGLMGVLRPERRQYFIRILFAIINADCDLLLQSFEKLGITIREEDREQLRDELYLTLLDAESFTAGSYSFGGLVGNLTDVLRRYQIRVPTNLMLMLKVLVMVLDIAAKLDPGFNFLEESRIYLKRISISQTLSSDVLNKATRSAIEVIDGMFELPKVLSQMMRRISSGTFRIEIVDTDIKKLQESLDRSSNKLLTGMIIAALVIGSSLVLSGSGITLPAGVFYIALFGYVIAVLLGFGALWQVLRYR